MCNTYLTDLQNCQMYILNGYICEYFDGGIFPTIQNILDSWNCIHGESERKYFTEKDIEDIIFKVSKFYK